MMKQRQEVVTREGIQTLGGQRPKSCLVPLTFCMLSHWGSSLYVHNKNSNIHGRSLNVVKVIFLLKKERICSFWEQILEKFSF